MPREYATVINCISFAFSYILGYHDDSSSKGLDGSVDAPMYHPCDINILNIKANIKTTVPIHRYEV